jgi:hypothetical protein
MNVLGLKEHMQPFFDLIKGSGVSYFWVASGAIRDYFTTGGITPKDIDVFFPSDIERDKAIKYLKSKGFKVEKKMPEGNTKIYLTKDKTPEEYSHITQGEKYTYHSIDLCCWNGKKDPACVAKTPEECIKWFDYTVEMAALDSNGEFIHHPTFENDINKKILIRNSLEDMYVALNIRRLLKYVKNDYTIDSENLTLWLEDQVNTIKYRKNVKMDKEYCGATWCKGPKNNG